MTPLRHKGFGSRLTGCGLSGELGGEVRLRLRPEGVVCDFNVPPGTA
ncbi:hypothetical protein [Methylobacterium oryzisoli]